MTFDPNVATTWDDEQKAVYETGYREGGNSQQADWEFALREDAHLPHDVKAYPHALSRYIVGLHTQIGQLAGALQVVQEETKTCYGCMSYRGHDEDCPVLAAIKAGHV